MPSCARPNLEVHTWATFTDISFHDCYVEAQATYPAGTVLQLKPEAQLWRVLVTGNVRLSYPLSRHGDRIRENDG